MYTAVMAYFFKPESVKEGIDLWKSHIGAEVTKQPGFIRAQVYSHETGKVIAIGSWQDKTDAETYMRKGDFANLLKVIEPLMVELPQGSTYQLEFFEGISTQLENQ